MSSDNYKITEIFILPLDVDSFTFKDPWVYILQHWTKIKGRKRLLKVFSIDEKYGITSRIIIKRGN